jgi:hypothetical protein
MIECPKCGETEELYRVDDGYGGAAWVCIPCEHPEEWDAEVPPSPDDVFDHTR